MSKILDKTLPAVKPVDWAADHPYRRQLFENHNFFWRWHPDCWPAEDRTRRRRRRRAHYGARRYA